MREGRVGEGKREKAYAGKSSIKLMVTAVLKTCGIEQINSTKLERSESNSIQLIAQERHIQP